MGARELAGLGLFDISPEMLRRAPPSLSLRSYDSPLSPPIIPTPNLIAPFGANKPFCRALTMCAESFVRNFRFPPPRKFSILETAFYQVALTFQDGKGQAWGIEFPEAPEIKNKDPAQAALWWRHLLSHGWECASGMRNLALLLEDLPSGAGRDLKGALQLYKDLKKIYEQFGQFPNTEEGALTLKGVNEAITELEGKIHEEEEGDVVNWADRFVSDFAFWLWPFSLHPFVVSLLRLLPVFKNACAAAKFVRRLKYLDSADQLASMSRRRPQSSRASTSWRIGVFFLSAIPSSFGNNDPIAFRRVTKDPSHTNPADSTASPHA